MKRNTILGIIVLSFIAFSPVFTADFINYDDPEYVLNNTVIRHFSLENIQHIFFGRTTDLYVPLTVFSYMLEYSLFGESARVFHVTNLLLHITNAILLFHLLLKLDIKSKSLIYAVLLFFTLNPLVTESVCWITERKDVLYALFYLLASIQFLSYMQHKNFKTIVWCFLFFLLSCLSKPMAVSLPLLFSLYLIFYDRKIILKHHLILIPFYGLSVLFSITSVLSLSSLGSIKANIIHYSFAEKGLLVLSEIGYYFIKPFMPFNQSLFHIFPETGKLFSDKGILCFALTALVILGFLIYQGFKKDYKLPLFLLLAWIIFLIPVLQIYSNTHSYVSERYFYVSVIFPVCIVFLFLQKTRISTNTYTYAITLLALVFTILTFKRSAVWKNSKTLFEAELKVNSNNPLALNNLGYYYNTTSDYVKASGLLKKAITIDSTNAFYLNNYGWALANTGYTDDATFYFQKAIDINPNYTEALNNIGICYMQKREPEKAAGYFKKAYEVSPDNRDVIFNLGLYYFNSGKKDLGLPMLQKAYELGNQKALKYLNM